MIVGRIFSEGDVFTRIFQHEISGNGGTGGSLPGCLCKGGIFDA